MKVYKATITSTVYVAALNEKDALEELAWCGWHELCLSAELEDIGRHVPLEWVCWVGNVQPTYAAFIRPRHFPKVLSGCQHCGKGQMGQ